MKLKLYLLMTIVLLLAFADSGAATAAPTDPEATIAAAIFTRVNLDSTQLFKVAAICWPEPNLIFLPIVVR